MNRQQPLIYWFRQDLRLHDLPGLNAAAATGQPLILVYIFDEASAGEWSPGGASRWWLHHSLRDLATSLKTLDAHLHLYRGNTDDVMQQLVHESGATAVYCSRAIEPWAQQQEEDLHRKLGNDSVELKRYPGSLLFDPERIQNKAGLPFKVFTPFWRNCLAQPEPGSPQTLPRGIGFSTSGLPSLSLAELALLPRDPDWAKDWDKLWQPGSKGAEAALSRFLDSGITDYDESRNHPARDATSRLSAHMHFGEFSPRQLWHAIKTHCLSHPELEHQRDKFLSELGWREFSHHLLYHFPTIPEHPFKTEFSQFPWLGSADSLQAWQKGETGYPIVDAGMRELWQTGYMHNRVRMIAASFLTKHLLLPWQLGERWFWDTLVDANLANNACGWQWVAGSGADASPYFRIFNPTLQGRKFDAQGDYVRRWVPELSALPDKYLHEPATAPADVLAQCGIALGHDYPFPVVEHRAAREAALSAHATLQYN